MDAHLTQQQLDGWDAGGDTPPDELLRVSEHLKDCEECRGRLKPDDGRIARAVAGLEAELRETSQEHLSFEQMQGLADRALDDVDEEIAATHLEDCRTCREEVEDLRSFAREPSSPPRIAPSRRRRTFARFAAAASLFFLIGLAVWTLRKPAASPPAATATSVHPPAPRAIAALRDAGGPVVLDDRGAVGGVPPSLAPAVAAVLHRGAFVPPAVLASLTVAGSALRGSHAHTLAIVAPAGRVVADDRPLFTWRGGDATSEVTVFDERGVPVAASGTLHASAWRPSRPLPRGVTLVWQVASGRALAPAADEPQARFRIVDGVTLGRIDAGRASGSHLALATAYAEAGLREEAEGEVRALRALNPGSPVADGLLRSLAGWPH